MRYYKNNSGAVAKMIRSAGRVVVMFNYRTMFFDSIGAAGAFLAGRGYY